MSQETGRSGGGGGKSGELVQIRGEPFVNRGNLNNLPSSFAGELCGGALLRSKAGRWEEGGGGVAESRSWLEIAGQASRDGVQSEACTGVIA